MSPLARKQTEKQNFLIGTFILVLSNAIVKIIGAVFKIPLMDIIGEKSYGVFISAYNVYAWIFVVATAGLPVAVSKMVAENKALGKSSEISRILRVVLTAFSIVGLIGSLLLFFGAETFAEMVRNPSAKEAIMAVAPAIFFVCIMATFRGYFQGQSNMVPTSISQIIEALCKLIIGLGLAYGLIHAGYPSNIVVAGAIFGVTVGSVLGAVVLIFIKRRNPLIIPARERSNTVSSRREILKKFIMIAIPITIGASVVNLTVLIDNFVVMDRLKYIFENMLNGMGIDRVYSVIVSAMPQYEAVVKSALADPEVMSVPAAIDAMANILWGAYSGMALNLFTLPTALITAVSISVLPAVSAAYVKGDSFAVSKTVETSMRFVVMLSLPIAAGFFVMAGPILNLLFASSPIGAEIAAPLLQSLSFGVLFICLVSLTNALLQATGRVQLPVLHMLIGGIVKFAANWILIGTPEINISGTPVGTVLCYGIITVLNLIAIIKSVKIRSGLFSMIAKPLLASAVMGVGVYFAYGPIDSLIGGKTATILAIFLGALIYFVSLLISRYIKRADVLMLPKGERIAKLLEKLL